ncbi:hypothetical protein ACQ4PT_047482 [Festuca glaucescens]
MSQHKQHNPRDLMECPPSLRTLNVFSSRTRQWQKKPFVREADAAGTFLHVSATMHWTTEKKILSVYWRGSLYVHFHGAFVMRLSLSDGKYRIIKTPTYIEECKQARPYIEKSEKWVVLCNNV